MSHISQQVRLPAVAGQFYTDNPDVLQQQVTDFLNRAEAHHVATPKAIIAPHAGYIYSGPVAATAYKTLASQAEDIKRVVILSPAHRYGFRGIAWSSADYFRTPLGDIAVDHASIAQLQDLAFVANLEQAFENEHALEVHLPFLQTVLNDFSIVPFIVGMAEAVQVAELLERLWGDTETLIVISSDLSHFSPYEQARQHDMSTCDKIEQLDYESISGEDACGTYPLSGLLLVARNRNLHVQRLDLRNSGDTAGSKDSVVGYGAFVVY